jgi:uncharacterized protein (TIGR04255 family)
MAKPRHLSRAPIVEAVVDVRAKTRAGFNPETLLGVHGQLLPAYRDKEEMSRLEFGFRQSGGNPPEQHVKDLGKAGYRFITSDKLQIVQFRADGFTFSRLAPYTRWEDLFEEASRLWAIYEKAAPLEEATRLAVRYINRLPLPTNKVQDFSPFLTAPPPVPKELNVLLNHFLTRVTVREPESPIVAHIVQAIQPAPSEEVISVILDIDVFETGAFAPTGGVILPRFAALRELKNRLFFSSLTEQAVALFE